MKVVEERFWAKVNKSGGPDSCWEWLAAKRGRGYGKFHVGKKPNYAHRFAYELEHGPIPEGLLACHKCDNPGCVNPNHLFLGTNYDNARDKEQKGRGNQVSGERHWQAKLTAAQVAEIRAAYTGGGITQTELAKRLGVDQATISRVVHGRIWKGQQSA